MAAGNGLANLSTYSASRASASAGSRKIIETAPWEIIYFRSSEDLNTNLCTHNSNFSCWPSIIGVTSQMFWTHNIICSSISFSCNNSNLWNSSFGICIKKFGTMSDDTVMLLSSTWNIIFSPNCSDLTASKWLKTFLSESALPGRKPGTSTRVMIGMLKASQNRTNRPALIEALISRHPAATFGFFG